MKTTRIIKKAAWAALLTGAGLVWATAGHADTLTFNQTPATKVVAEMSRRLGVTIVFRGNVDASRAVTFSVDDPDTPDGRLQAVSELASEMGLDFQKVYVVSKIDAGATVPDVPIDSNAPIVFSSTTVSAREAIQTVAAVDGALAQISGAIDGDVTLPRRRMGAVEAAALIAKQTQTGWKAYYGMFRRGQGPDRLNGVVVDRTRQGQPITELPLLTFRTPAAPPASTTGTANPGSSTPGSSVNGMMANGAYAYNPYAFNPYAFNPYASGNPYGYNPYGYGGMGYGGMGYGGFPGLDTSSGAGMGLPSNGGPGVITVPNTSATVLPDFPYAGTLGGPVAIGGY